MGSTDHAKDDPSNPANLRWSVVAKLKRSDSPWDNVAKRDTATPDVNLVAWCQHQGDRVLPGQPPLPVLGTRVGAVSSRRKKR